MLLHTSLITHRIKRLTIFTLKLIVTTSINQDNKVSLIWVDEDVALESYSEFAKTCHNINITVKITGGYAS